MNTVDTIAMLTRHESKSILAYIVRAYNVAHRAASTVASSNNTFTTSLTTTYKVTH